MMMTTPRKEQTLRFLNSTANDRLFIRTDGDVDSKPSCTGGMLITEYLRKNVTNRTNFDHFVEALTESSYQNRRRGLTGRQGVLWRFISRRKGDGLRSGCSGFKCRSLTNIAPMLR